MIMGEDDRQRLTAEVVRGSHDPLVVHRVTAVDVQQPDLFIDTAMHKSRSLDNGDSHSQQVVQVVVPTFGHRLQAAIVTENFLSATEQPGIGVIVERLLECFQPAGSQFIIGVQPNDPLPERPPDAFVDGVRKTPVLFGDKPDAGFPLQNFHGAVRGTAVDDPLLDLDLGQTLGAHRRQVARETITTIQAGSYDGKQRTVHETVTGIFAREI